MANRCKFRSVHRISRRIMSAGVTLCILIGLTTCSGLNRYEPSPDEILHLMLSLPPVPTPPVTPANESTLELETAIGMGKVYVDWQMKYFRSTITPLLDLGARPLGPGRGYRWCRLNPIRIELTVWTDDGIHFELQGDSDMPEYFRYLATGRFTPTWSRGELHEWTFGLSPHQMFDLQWSTTDEGLLLELDKEDTMFSAFDSTDGGGWIVRYEKYGFQSGSSVHWDRFGNIEIHYWVMEAGHRRASQRRDREGPAARDRAIPPPPPAMHGPDGSHHPLLPKGCTL